MNLAFLPLLSLYGLRVCPVLEPLGFLKSCSYTGVFVFLVTALNSAAVLILPARFPRVSFSGVQLAAGSFLIYLLATAAALGVLQMYLHVTHFSQFGRAPEILAFASIMLATTQSYGLSWALAGRSTVNEAKVKSFDSLWISHISKSLLPILVILAVCIHFLFAQSVSGNDGRVSSLSDHDGLIDQTIMLLGILGGWLAITFMFFFLNERDFSSKVKRHLENMRSDNYSYKTDLNQTWGLWRFILGTLNEFSNSKFEKSNLEHLVQLLEESEKMLKEKNDKFIELSSAVQSLFLPERSHIKTRSWEISGFYKPMDGCGGDWWSYAEKNNTLQLVLGDVTGHGPGSAMMTASVATYMRAIEKEKPDLTVPDTLSALNSYLLDLQTRKDSAKYLMTMSAVQVDFEKKILHSWFAGAPFGYLLSANGDCDVIGDRGSPLGVSGSFTLGYEMRKFNSGDRLVMLTDGLLEASLRGLGSNEKKLIKMFRASMKEPPVQLTVRLEEYFNDNLLGSQDDDYTMVVLDLA